MCTKSPDFYDKEKMDKNLSNTGYTAAWVLDTIYSNNEKFRTTLNEDKVESISVEDISAGQGFASTVYKVNIKFNNTARKDFHFCMKIPCFSNFEAWLQSDEQASKDAVSALEKAKIMAATHNRECEFFDILKGNQHFPLPEIYYLKKAEPIQKEIGAIFMEYLDNSTTLGIDKTLDVNQVKIIVSHIAKFHAYLWSDKSPEWKGKFTKIPYSQADFCGFLSLMASKAVEMRPDDYKKAVDNLGVTYFEGEFAQLCTRDCCDKQGIPLVLCHGDMWSNNIMWKLRPDDGTPSNKVRAFIDAQVCFEGNPACDIARLITLCTDAEVRRELETLIFDHYFKVLSEESKKLGTSVDFSLAKIKIAYKYAMIHETKNLLCITAFRNALLPTDEIQLSIHNAKIDKLALRTRLALEDAFKYFQEISA